MQKRRWIEDLNSWEGFQYLRLKGVPMKRSKEGGAIDFDYRKLSMLIAKEIVQSKAPLRGQELKFLRSVVQLSMSKFSHKLGLSYGAIYHWEKNEKQRLSPINEIAVRLLCAEELGVTLSGSFAALIGVQRHEPIIVLVTSRKPTPKHHKTEIVLRPSYRGDRKVRVRTK